MGISAGGDGVSECESWFVVVTCVMAHEVCAVITFNARSMEFHDAMCPHVGIPHSRWCNLGGVILCPGVMAFDGWMTFVGNLVRFNLVPTTASENPSCSHGGIVRVQGVHV
jgi:hypothetical protein